jgi:sensor c-di-GMP phosphodiesterase-like protein
MPELIMLDLLMPGTDGVELLRVLAEQVKDAKICLMSGSDARVLNSARRLGGAHGLNVVAALEKPLEIAAIRGALDLMAGVNQAAPGSELARALEQGQLVLYYQPLIEMATHRVKGAEALIRWLHPERGMVSPAQLIPLSEETGLILPIGHWVLETACAQLKAWENNALTRDLVLSINVSPKQFRQADFVEQVQTLVQRHAINPRLLKLELTESMLLDN